MYLQGNEREETLFVTPSLRSRSREFNFPFCTWTKPQWTAAKTQLNISDLIIKVKVK